MKDKTRAFIAGVAGMAVAFGLIELAHGLFEFIPSVPVAVSQRVIVLTPGPIVEFGIALLGEADIPVLVSMVVLLTLAAAGLLARLALKSVAAALAGVAVLGAIAVVASLSEPSVRPFAVLLAAIAALGIGGAITYALLRAAGLVGEPGAEPASEPSSGEGEPQAEPQGSRAKEAHSAGGIAVSRRNFVALSGAAAVAGLATAGVGRVLTQQGLQVVSTGGSSGAVPAAGETLAAAPAAASLTDVPGMPPLFTPNEDFYLIDTVVSSPRINVDNWTLNVMGEVDNPIELTYDDLLGFSTIERDITLSCVSNEVGGGLVSNARWTGVLLSDVLAEAGMSRDKITSASEQLVGRSVDSWTGGFPTDVAFDGREALVAFGMNGEELPLEHGYPVRLVVPGLYGYVSATKWLTEIELIDWGFDAYWIKRGWGKEGPIKTQSRIDTISDGETYGAGTIRVGGIAWAPTRGISRVEVSTDDGETWNEATLAAQLDVDAWRQYVYDWDASSAGDYTVKVRATDGEGETQTAEETAPLPDGATGYHAVTVTVE